MKLQFILLYNLYYIDGMEAEFNSAEEVAIFQHFFPNLSWTQLVDVRKDIRSPENPFQHSNR